MLYSANQLTPTSVSVLESLCYLTEAESKYDPCMVSIKNSRRLDQDKFRKRLKALPVSRRFKPIMWLM